MSKRIIIVLPETTLRTIDRMVKPGERSRFINQAVEHFVATQSQETLLQRLEQTTVRDCDLDREVMDEWLGVDQQTWGQLDTLGQPSPKASRSARRNPPHVARPGGRPRDSEGHSSNGQILHVKGC